MFAIAGEKFQGNVDFIDFLKVFRLDYGGGRCDFFRVILNFNVSNLVNNQ